MVTIQINKRNYHLKGFNLKKGFTYMLNKQSKTYMPTYYKLNFNKIKLKVKDKLLPISFNANILNANKVFLNALHYAQGYSDATRIKDIEFMFY